MDHLRHNCRVLLQVHQVRLRDLGRLSGTRADEVHSCGAAAKVGGMDWRESGAVGSLMACKGLVEVSWARLEQAGRMTDVSFQLIVLNIGLQAGILNPEVFAMFVTMALCVLLSSPLATKD